MKPKQVDPKKVIQLIAALNAAIWLGGAVFFTFIAGPAVFSSELETILPKPENGIAARFMISKFAAFQMACATLSVISLLLNWRFNLLGHLKHLTLLLFFILLFLGLGVLFLTPKMDALFQLKYADYFGLQPTSEEKESASKAFGQLHGISQVGNLLVLIGLLVNFILCWKNATGPRETNVN
ncbi:MAG: DUF4149 domain-containing protein [Verrucomicrobiota bacterium]|nr:DUF4149 domain-containing protein [Verrucomicrobiota bacterium]